MKDKSLSDSRKDRSGRGLVTKLEVSLLYMRPACTTDSSLEHPEKGEWGLYKRQVWRKWEQKLEPAISKQISIWEKCSFYDFFLNHRSPDKTIGSDDDDIFSDFLTKPKSTKTKKQ